MRRPTVFAIFAVTTALAARALAEEPAAPPPQASVVIAPSPGAAALAARTATSTTPPPVPPKPAPVASKPAAAKASAAKPAKKPATTAKASPNKDELPAGMKWHVVKKGQKLGSIAKRYRVTIPALCTANDMARRDTLRPGMKLLVPASADTDGELARATRAKLLGVPERGEGKSGDGDKLAAGVKKGEFSKETARDARKSKQDPEKETSWKPFVARPKKKGVVTLKGMKGEFHGRLVARSGKLAPKARREAEHVLSADDGVEMDPELLKLLVRVSDTFGGKTLEVVSGYRTAGTAEQSRHKQGKALDFTVEGVPNEALRDYCKSLDGVGVGYYPNSGFVHLDVRERWTYWVDESGRGEPPRYVETTAKPTGSAEGPEVRVR